MKKRVHVKLESRQLDGDNQAQSTQGDYEGTWYQQDGQSYLIFQEPDKTQTTLKISPDEWRLFRRGPEIESWQVFRKGEAVPTQLTLMGSVLPLLTYTKRFEILDTPTGAELQLEYDLYSNDNPLGSFTLILHLTITGEEPAHA